MKTRTLVPLFTASLVIDGVYSQNASTRISHAGINLPGLANDVSVLGSAYSLFEGANCNASYAAFPYIDPPDHFYEWHDLGFNLFRLPLAWQHAQVDLDGPLNETTMGVVDGLIDLITGNNGTAILDIVCETHFSDLVLKSCNDLRHNYARWYCSIIGQPENDILTPNGPHVSEENFIDLWTKLASRYGSNPNVLFQLMNEPHDLNMTKWATTNQKVITAIRNVTMTNHILVSGTQFARLTNWPIYSMTQLSTISDPANKLIFDYHQYFDDDGGAYGVCEPWSTFVTPFEEVTNFLRGSGKQGILTEFGGAPVASCVELFESLLTYLEDNQDVWYGWTAWGSEEPGTDLSISLNATEPQNTLAKVLMQFAPGQTE